VDLLDRPRGSRRPPLDGELRRGWRSPGTSGGGAGDVEPTGVLGEMPGTLKSPAPGRPSGERKLVLGASRGQSADPRAGPAADAADPHPKAGCSRPAGHEGLGSGPGRSGAVTPRHHVRRASFAKILVTPPGVPARRGSVGGVCRGSVVGRLLSARRVPAQAHHSALKQPGAKEGAVEPLGGESRSPGCHGTGAGAAPRPAAGFPTWCADATILVVFAVCSGGLQARRGAPPCDWSGRISGAAQERDHRSPPHSSVVRTPGDRLAALLSFHGLLSYSHRVWLRHRTHVHRANPPMLHQKDIGHPLTPGRWPEPWALSALCFEGRLFWVLTARSAISDQQSKRLGNDLPSGFLARDCRHQELLPYVWEHYDGTPEELSRVAMTPAAVRGRSTFSWVARSNARDPPRRPQHLALVQSPLQGPGRAASSGRSCGGAARRLPNGGGQRRRAEWLGRELINSLVGPGTAGRPPGGSFRPPRGGRTDQPARASVGPVTGGHQFLRCSEGLFAPGSKRGAACSTGLTRPPLRGRRAPTRRVFLTGGRRRPGRRGRRSKNWFSRCSVRIRERGKMERSSAGRLRSASGEPPLGWRGEYLAPDSGRQGLRRRLLYVVPARHHRVSAGVGGVSGSCTGSGRAAARAC